ncbi:MAG TPA: thioredoxin family protein [Bryocella sp.]|nr:thioredoxin family protein [Bryocella sp.]
MQTRWIGNGMRVVATNAVLGASAMLLGGMLLTGGCKSAPAPAPPSEQPAVPATPVTTAQPAPIPHEHIYPDVQAAHSETQTALVKARAEHKRVILDFGGDWCGDCQVLNIYFHQSPNAELLEKNFVLVDVNIGRMDQNLDIAHKYGVPVQGVPALAVLSPSGKVIYSQNKEFADMRNMDPQSVTEFLNKWKG